MLEKIYVRWFSLVAGGEENNDTITRLVGLDRHKKDTFCPSDRPLLIRGIFRHPGCVFKDRPEIFEYQATITFTNPDETFIATARRGNESTYKMDIKLEDEKTISNS